MNQNFLICLGLVCISFAVPPSPTWATSPQKAGELNTSGPTDGQEATAPKTDGTPADTPAKKEGNAETPKPESDKEKFTKALDELEIQILAREKRGKYGHPQIEAYAKELEEEFVANDDALNRSGGALAGRSSNRVELVNRQQHISLLLWQLERVGAEMAQPRTANNSLSMMTKIHSLLTQYREVMKDRAVMQRYHALTRRASELSRMSLASRLTNNFRFIRPDRSPTIAIDDPQAIPKATPDKQDHTSTRETKFPIGPIQTIQEPIGHLVRLRWDDGFLTWDENHWDAPFAGHTLQSIDQQVQTDLKARGVEFPNEDRMAGFRKKRLFETPPAMLLFQNLQHITTAGNPANRSYSTSGGTGRSRFFASDIEAAIEVAENKTEFSVREESGPNRTLEIRRRNGRELRLSLIGDHITLLEQSPDGSVRWVDVGEEVTSMRANSFAELYSLHADQIENNLLARLSHCGIITPMTRFEPTIVNRMMDQIHGVDATTQSRFDELILAMDSGSFVGRQKAFRELSENVATFSILLERISNEDNRSPEAKSRLTELRKRYDREFSQVDALIAKAGWLSQPDYLIGLAGHVEGSSVAAITDRLESVTGQSFGNDLDRWRQWASNR